MMVRVRFVVGCWHARRVVAPGEVLDLEPRDAIYAISGGRAVALDSEQYRNAIAEFNEVTMRRIRMRIPRESWIAH